MYFTKRDQNQPSHKPLGFPTILVNNFEKNNDRQFARLGGIATLKFLDFWVNADDMFICWEQVALCS